MMDTPQTVPPTSETDAPEFAGLPARHVGIWRMVSFAAVALAIVVTVIYVLQSRDTADDVAASAQPVELIDTSVVVRDLVAPAGAQVAALSVDGRDLVPLDNGNARVALPRSSPSLIGLFDGQGDLHGLAYARVGQAGGTVQLSPATTARMLLALTPALLEHDLERVGLNLDQIEPDPAFLALIDAVASSPNLSQPNPTVEQALAQILDLVPPRTPQPEQGCDSIQDPLAYTVAGTCVQPGDEIITLTNNHRRWVIGFTRDPSSTTWANPCAALAPASRPGSVVEVARTTCAPPLLLSAPGPILESTSTETLDAIRTATAVNVVASYVAPVAALAGGATPANRDLPARILESPAVITAAIEPLLTEPAFTSALDVLVTDATPVERHAATVSIARMALSGDTGSALFDGFNEPASTHGIFLDLYDRAGEQMSAFDRSDWQWRAEAAGIIEAGEGDT